MDQTESLIASTLFYYPETIPDTVQAITSDMFASASARELFDAIVVLQATGQELTFSNLGGQVKPQTLSVFMAIDEPPTSELLKSALRKFKQAHALRRISKLSAAVQQAVETGNDTAELVAELHKLQTAVPDSLTIYGVEGLSRQGQVLLFFDKRSRQLSEKILTDVIPIATTSNIKKLSRLNLSILRGRKVIIWRGEHQEASDHLYHLLTKAGAAGVRVIRNPSEQAASFGIIEAVEHAGWDAKQIFGYIKANLVDPAKDEEETALAAQGSRPYEPDDTDPLPDHSDAPYQCLGFDHNVYFYLPHGSNQVIPLRADQHSQSHLITIAPLNWWESCYPGKQGANFSAAANALIRHQERKGVYDPSRLRGRGAWEDAGRSVLHLGDVMYVDGAKIDPHAVKTKYVYEAAASMEYDTPCSPLPVRPAAGTRGASEFLDLCNMLTWERPIYGTMLAGWCALAPICGALDWRPHIHITGGAGAGKTTVMFNIIAPVVGPASIKLTGSITAAAIRQYAGCDARPVLADEFEAEKESSTKRIEDILELARACSSDSDAITIKGGADGKAKVYRSRLAFCFSSIGVNATQYADISRVTVLSLRAGSAENQAANDLHFKKIVAAIDDLLTEEYCCAYRARMVQLIPIIKRNCKTFASAVAVTVGTQRTGDQLGALLALAYAHTSNREITAEEARAWIEARDWSEYTNRAEQLDESRCLSKILETIVRVQGIRQTYDLNIGELIHIANGGTHDVSSDIADTTLRRHGIRVDIYGSTVSISNTHDAIKRWLDKTPWANNWRQFLARIPGAEKTDTMRFSPGSPPSKAVALPLSVLGEA